MYWILFKLQVIFAFNLKLQLIFHLKAVNCKEKKKIAGCVDACTYYLYDCPCQQWIRREWTNNESHRN